MASEEDGIPLLGKEGVKGRRGEDEGNSIDDFVMGILRFSLDDRRLCIFLRTRIRFSYG